jgi:putative membrane protein
MFRHSSWPTRLASSLAVAAAIAGAAPASAATTALSAQDQTFVQKAAQGGMAEVADATVVSRKTSDPAVKAFAQRMIDDHGKANAKLETIARTLGVTLPSSIGPDNSAMKGKLQNESGKTLDSTYLTGQRTAHEQTIALFKQEAQSGSNPQLVAFAKATLPTIESHLQMDEKDISSMSGGSGSGNM